MNGMPLPDPTGTYAQHEMEDVPPERDLPFGDSNNDIDDPDSTH